MAPPTVGCGERETDSSLAHLSLMIKIKCPANSNNTTCQAHSDLQPCFVNLHLFGHVTSD